MDWWQVLARLHGPVPGTRLLFWQLVAGAAIGMALCYIGWLVEAAGKDVDRKLQELRQSRRGQGRGATIGAAF